MKVLMLNGSAHQQGNTYQALEEVGKQLRQEGIDYEIFQIGGGPIRDCIGCHKCTPEGCIFTDDTVNEFIAKGRQADALIIGSPVYYAHPSGRILSFLDRAFYSCGGSAFRQKPGAAIAVARRAGTTAAFDVLNKYFGISQMPVIGSTYWNIAHGQKPGQISEDLEGLQTMRNLAKNMAWILKCIEAGKQAGIEAPEAERQYFTNFIR